jgi:hypothetical protein
MAESVVRTAPRSRTPVHLWIVGVVALLWNAMGCFDYLATQYRMDFYMSHFTQEQLDYFYGAPAWLTAVWAIAVWGGLAGALGLLLRRRWAVWLFAASLLALAISTAYNAASGGFAIMGPEAVYFTIVIWVLAIFFVWYAHRMSKAGVLT